MENIYILKQYFNLDESTLNEIMLHSSYLNENKNDEISIKNKIRANIGNSIVKLISKLYYINETTYKVGQINSMIDTEAILGDFYNEYALANYVIVGKGEKQNTNKLYIDHGKMIIFEYYKKNGLAATYELTKKFISRNPNIDYKSLLQQYAQKLNEQPVYKVIDSVEGGLNNYFTVEVTVSNKSGVATYSNKKGAEKMAAQALFKNNKINIHKINKTNKNIELLRKDYTWEVSNDRKNTLINGIKSFNFSQSGIKLPAYIWDSSFTHRSKQHVNKDTNTLFITLGAEIIDIYIQIYLLDNWSRYINNEKTFYIEKGMILKENNLETVITNRYGKRWLKALDFAGDVDINKLSVETYKSLLGAILFYNFKKRKEMMSTLDEFYKNSIKELEIIQNDIDRNDYKNWLQDFEQQLGITVYKQDEKVYGLEHRPIHYSKLIMNLENYHLNNIEVEAEASSKSKLNDILTKNMHHKLRKLLDLNSNEQLKYMENYNIFFRDIVNYILIKNAFFNTKLELLGYSTSDEKIIKNLYKKGLYRELKSFINTKGIKEYHNKKYLEDISEINIFLKNQCENNDDEEETYIQKNILLDKNINFEEQVKIYKRKYYKINRRSINVLFEVVEFTNDKCHYCDGNLEYKFEPVFTTSKEGIYPILSEVSYCPICNVYGLNDNQAKKIKERDFQYRAYKGSAAYYTSCIVTFNNFDVFLPNESKGNTWTKRATTPEELEHQLKIMKDIGLKGEEIIFNYEKNLLISMNRSDLAEKVEWTAQKDCTAGYDILSYDENGNPKFIEVKSSTGSSDRFYLTKNEIDIAREHGDNYYIYKVNNIKSTPYINKIKNPLECIDLGKLHLEPTQFSVSLT